MQRAHGLEACKQCNVVPLLQNGTYLPVRFSQAEEETPPVLPISFDSTQEIEDGLIKLSSTLSFTPISFVLFLDCPLMITIIDKFYNLTEPLLESLLRELTFEVPFELTPEELRIVSHFTTSTLILGRSGTGKTTCLVFKLLAQFQARRLISEEEPIRQACIPSTVFTAHLMFCVCIGSSYKISVFGKQAKFLYPKSHQISGSKFLSRKFLER